MVAHIFRHSSNAYSVAAGDVLFREGDHGDVMFAVVDGSVDQREFTYLVQEHPTFALQVMRTMASRLRRTNEGLSSPA